MSNSEKGQHSQQIKSPISWTSKCMNTTYFLFWGDYYQQKNGITMGSTVSPVVATIYMESWRMQHLELNRHPDFGKDMLRTPSVWLKRWMQELYWTISTAYVLTPSSAWKRKKMEAFLSWTRYDMEGGWKYQPWSLLQDYSQRRVRLLSAVFHGYRYRADKSTKICVKILQDLLINIRGGATSKNVCSKS